MFLQRWKERAGVNGPWWDIASAIKAIRFRVKWALFHRWSLRENARQVAFDQQYGTDTAGYDPLTTYGVSASDAARGHTVYRGLGERFFLKAMAELPISLDGFTFIDYGSGKGGLMLLAASFPFKRIIGVEYAPGLHDVAVRNCQIYRNAAQKCFDLTPLQMDATKFEPPEDRLVCFFFNPFDADTMRAVLARLQASIERTRRDVFLVYVNVRNVAEAAEVFDTLPFFTLVKKTRNVLVFKNPS